jgi:hypothetical protein
MRQPLRVGAPARPRWRNPEPSRISRLRSVPQGRLHPGNPRGEAEPADPQGQRRHPPALLLAGQWLRPRAPGRFLELINYFNTNATTATFYIDDDGDLGFLGWFISDYEKMRFAQFLERWNRDWADLVQRDFDRARKFLE